MGRNMSLKLHFLHSDLDFFLENKAAVSKEHGEKFCQDSSQMGKTYSGKWSPNMLADYWWSLIREAQTGECKWQKKMKWGFNVYFVVLIRYIVKLFIEFFILGNSPSSEFYVPVFQNSLFHLHRRCKLTLPIKMEQTECSEMSAHKIQMMGNHPKERIQRSEHGESLKLRTFRYLTL